MIRTLTGTIKDLGEDWLVLEVNGVGYLVASPTLTNSFTLEQKVTLQTYLAVRETALDLYGFVDSTELQMFELLLGVPKVGPKSALVIMTQATPTLLSESAHKNDAVYLHKLSGIGKKTCENVVRYLNSKLENLPTTSASSDMTDGLNQVQTDAIDALVSLGYDLNTAREAIKNMPEEGATVNTLVTQALKQIN
ncbi:Holliday junction branch migration protein RuvA [Candidatus Nomurabacteria bacterium]|nr:Holliday junction branch migration protein RuvA [Candidatus Nomurabacteria bacterium]